MNKLLLIIGLLYVTSCSFSKNTNNNVTIQLLSSSLGEAFTVREANSLIYYRYCPDNTCEELISSKDNYKKLNEFTLLYFFYASGYVYLKMDNNGSFIGKAEKYVKHILSKERDCVGDEYQIASCIMQRLINTGIKANDVRYDENVESRTAINLKQQVSIKNLHRIESWRKHK